MVKIAFWDNGLGERGTSVSLYDYAHYNETILYNKSIIMYNNTHYSNKQSVIKKFKDRFKVYDFNDWSEVDNVLLSEKCDILYVIKAGDWDGQISNICKTVVHCVFTCNMPHGNIYASIAPWVDNNNGRYPFVPHMINLPEHNQNMRDTLNIPIDAVVYGRHGGYEQFDIEYVQRIIVEVAKQNTNIYFLFVNTKPFCENLKNIIHIPIIIDLDEKVKFINTCDAMIWARSGGEVFSLSQGEFSIKNKPILCCNIGYPGHTHLLQDKAIWYNQSILKDIIVNFNKEEMQKKDWNAYKYYTPENVMGIFKKVFID
jgi:hypothetical protein